MNDEFDFLHADKHESFLQSVTMIFDGDGQAFPKFENSKFTMSLWYLKKKLERELIFCL